MTAAWLIAALALRESLRRRVLAVVVALTVLFGALYTWGCHELFKDVSGFDTGDVPIDSTALAGATILGLAMFGTLFLGAVLAVFLTLGAVRGDAERGLLQPLVVRPLGRAWYLVGRWAAAATVSAAYVLLTFGSAVLVTGVVGDWWPDRVIVPGLELAAAVAVISALSLLGSVFLSATANGIGVLMVFGAGLLSGLLGSIGDALRSRTLEHIADVGSWLLPFEALYRDALRQLVASVHGVAGVIVQLGPLGGSHGAGPLLGPWTALYTALVGLLAVVAFARRDL